jgi:hypothetical protein
VGAGSGERGSGLHEDGGAGGGATLDGSTGGPHGSGHHARQPGASGVGTSIGDNG